MIKVAMLSSVPPKTRQKMESRSSGPLSGLALYIGAVRHSGSALSRATARSGSRSTSSLRSFFSSSMASPPDCQAQGYSPVREAAPGPKKSEHSDSKDERQDHWKGEPRRLLAGWTLALPAPLVLS